MSDIFISYAREDRERARTLADVLEARGWSVWWDREIPVGKPFDNVIERELAAARCVLALWSSASIASEWVKNEATDAAERKVLVPVFLERVQPPLAFRRIQAAMLQDWQPPAPSEELDRLFEAIGALLGEAPPPPAVPVPRSPPLSLRARLQAAKAALRHRQTYSRAAAFILVTAFVLLCSWTGLLGLVGIDDWVESRFLAHVEPYVAPPRAAALLLLWASDKAAENGPLGVPSPDWRRYHAEMLDALADAGVSVVVFDLRFEAPSPEWDDRFAESIRRATAKGTRVVAGVADFGVTDGVLRPRMGELASVSELRWGTIEGSARHRRLQLARRLPGSLPGWAQGEALPIVPSLALRTAMEYERPASGEELRAQFLPGADTVVVRGKDGQAVLSVPVVDRGLDMLLSAARGTELEQLPYHQMHAALGSGALRPYRGKIVVIGYRTPDEVAWIVSPTETRWEMEIQASAIAEILGGTTLRRAWPHEQYVAILLMGAVGWLSRARVARASRAARLRGAPFVLFAAALVVYALAAFILLKQGRIVLGIPYDLAAMAVGYFAAGWAPQGRPAVVPRALVASPAAQP